jgi:hypothetical protein
VLLTSCGFLGPVMALVHCSAALRCLLCALLPTADACGLHARNMLDVDIAAAFQGGECVERCCASTNAFYVAAVDWTASCKANTVTLVTHTLQIDRFAS